MTDFDKEMQDLNFKVQMDMGTLITAHIADLHFPVMDPQKQYTILEEQFISKLLSMPRLDLICVEGDLYNNKVQVSSDAALYATLFVSRLVDVCKVKNATLIIIQGTLSHDSNQLKIYYHYMQRNDVDVRIVTNIRFEIVKGTRILCIPELYGLPEEYYQYYLFGSGLYDMCIMHGTIQGAVYGDNVGSGRLFRIEDFLNCRGPIISGHIHKPDVFYDHFYYCGSPYRWRFDDDHMKGFILMSYNRNTRMYFLDREEIISDNYKTITLDQLVKNDPIETIKYIRDLKLREGINYIRIIFSSPMEGSNKIALSDQFRNDPSVTLEFFSKEKEIAKAAEEKMKVESEEVKFLLDNKLTDEQKLVMWVNYKKNQERYLTIEELEAMLRDG